MIEFIPWVHRQRERQAVLDEARVQQQREHDAAVDRLRALAEVRAWQDEGRAWFDGLCR